MTREFWVRRNDDGSFGTTFYQDQKTLEAWEPGGSPIKLVPVTELETLQKEAAWYRLLRDDYIFYKPAGYDGRNVGRFDLVWDYPENNLDAACEAAIATQRNSSS